MAQTNSGLVSIITPTYNRSAHLSRLRSFVLHQDHKHIEWLILDDSDEPDAGFSNGSHDFISYEHIGIGLSLGEKRNHLISKARGEFVVQFDDDDYYASNYISSMIHMMKKDHADIANLKSWFLLDLRSKFFGYWDLTHKRGRHYCCDTAGVSTVTFSPEVVEELKNNEYGYGFTYVFRRAVWETCQFPAIDFDEDSAFFNSVREKFRSISLRDQAGICLHILHSTSTSRCFPQHHLPHFLLSRIFPAYTSGAG